MRRTNIYELAGLAALAVSLLWVVSKINSPFVEPDPEPVSPAELRSNSLVIALSTECPFCDLSAPFHRTLVQAGKAVGVNVNATFLIGGRAGESYLRERNIGADLIDNTPYAAVARGTPAVLLVGPDGSTLRVWRGLLDKSAMEEVVRSVGIADEFSAAMKLGDADLVPRVFGVPSITANELSGLEREEQRLVVLDTRPRQSFSALHILGAVNIPHDELELRVPIELGDAQTIVMFCNYDIACEDWNSESGLQTQCATAARTLQQLRPGQVRVLTETVGGLLRQGIAMEPSRSGVELVEMR